MNNFDCNIKFSDEVNKESIQFFDLNIRLSDGNVSIDLYVNSTGRHQFLHYISSRPDNTKCSIVFSQALRVSRICLEKLDFLKHLEKMKTWLLVRGYPEYLIESDVKRVKFVSKNRNTERGKSFKAIPFVMTYHPKLNSLKEIILKYLDLLYTGDKVKRVFTHKPMISFRRARKLSSYLVRAKLYPTERIEGCYKCGRKRREVCINVDETSTFTSTVTGETFIISFRFDCNEICLVYLLNCNKCKMQYVGQTIEQFRSRWNFYKSDLRKNGQGAKCMQEHLFKQFCTSGQCNFLEDVSLAFVDKTDPSDRLKREDYWRSRVKTMAPFGLNIE